MAKKKILLLIIVLLFIPIVWLSIKYLSLSQKYDFQQNNIDNEFKSTLGRAMSYFSLDFGSTSKENENLIEHSYNESLVNLYSASRLARFTTYSKDGYLSLALSNLYELMEQNEHKEGITKKSKLIYDDLEKLFENPEDKRAVDNIVKLTEEIRNGE